MPKLMSRSTSDGDPTRFDMSCGLASFKNKINRLRSSSNVTVVDKALQESDFKRMDDWYLGFHRYNQVVTTEFSPNQKYMGRIFQII